MKLPKDTATDDRLVVAIIGTSLCCSERRDTVLRKVAKTKTGDGRTLNPRTEHSSVLLHKVNARRDETERGSWSHSESDPWASSAGQHRRQRIVPPLED
jgi:hypothetical protein